MDVFEIVRQMRLRHYILEGTQPRLSEDLDEWQRAFMDAHRNLLALSILRRDVEVSTVFLCLDFNHARMLNPDLPPILFETHVFGGALDGEEQRYYTWNEAMTGHGIMVGRARDALTGHQPVSGSQIPS